MVSDPGGHYPACARTEPRSPTRILPRPSPPASSSRNFRPCPVHLPLPNLPLSTSPGLPWAATPTPTLGVPTRPPPRSRKALGWPSEHPPPAPGPAPSVNVSWEAAGAGARLHPARVSSPGLRPRAGANPSKPSLMLWQDLKPPSSSSSLLLLLPPSPPPFSLPPPPCPSSSSVSPFSVPPSPSSSSLSLLLLHLSLHLPPVSSSFPLPPSSSPPSFGQQHPLAQAQALEVLGRRCGGGYTQSHVGSRQQHRATQSCAGRRVCGSRRPCLVPEPGRWRLREGCGRRAGKESSAAPAEGGRGEGLQQE